MAETPTPTPATNKPAAGDTAGTSRQPSNEAQERNQQANPDAENAAGNAAAPGVTPTNKVNQEPAASLEPAELEAGNEPAPHTAVPEGPKRTWYVLRQGKHRWTNEAGEDVVARSGDRVLLTQTQYDSGRDRFDPAPKE